MFVFLLLSGACAICCVQRCHARASTHAHQRGHRYLGRSLDAAVTRSNVTDPTKFALVTGVADSSVFATDQPNWNQPAGKQDLCYIGAMRSLLKACAGFQGAVSSGWP
jgi:hypothetical protein